MNKHFLTLYNYLFASSNGKRVGMSNQIIEEAGEALKVQLHKQFNTERASGLELSMSNVGKPTCQLQMQKMNSEKEPNDYNFVIKMMFGHFIEILTVAVLKASGVPVKDEQKEVSLSYSRAEVIGHLDFTIDEKVWDVKSCSPYAFESKFKKGYSSVIEKDDFGYTEQGFGYSLANCTPFGGWIAVNKVTGEIEFVEIPEYQPYLANDAGEKIYNTVKLINSNKPFKRCFSDESELFYKKDTGNRILGFNCSWCPYKKTCWPGVQRLKQQVGTGKKYKWYTKLKEE